jgi:phosphohistidine phosphatase
MQVYLVQHGEAMSKGDDPHRPLTEQGRRDVAHVAVALKRHELPLSAIWHSGKLRARQTAAAFAEALEPGEAVQEKSGLSPKDDPEPLAEVLGELEAPVMVVGHLPHLSRLASLMIVGDPDREIVRFRQGAVLCLAQTAEGWRVGWYLTPELARVVTA